MEGMEGKCTHAHCNPFGGSTPRSAARCIWSTPVPAGEFARQDMGIGKRAKRPSLRWSRGSLRAGLQASRLDSKRALTATQRRGPLSCHVSPASLKPFGRRTGIVSPPGSPRISSGPRRGSLSHCGRKSPAASSTPNCLPLQSFSLRRRKRTSNPIVVEDDRHSPSAPERGGVRCQKSLSFSPSRFPR